MNEGRRVKITILKVRSITVRNGTKPIAQVPIQKPILTRQELIDQELERKKNKHAKMAEGFAKLELENKAKRKDYELRKIEERLRLKKT